MFFEKGLDFSENLDSRKNNVFHWVLKNPNIHKRIEELRFLIEYCVEKSLTEYLRSPNVSGETPLLTYLRYNKHVHKDILKMLYGYGCNIHMVDTHGNTSLHCASLNGDISESVMVFLLSRKGGGTSKYFNNKNKSGELPLVLMKNSHHPKGDEFVNNLKQMIGKHYRLSKVLVMDASGNLTYSKT